MPVVETHKLQPGQVPFALQTYNALDCCLTYEILEELETTYGTGANAPHNVTYTFERALQAPYLDIMLRGFKIDQSARRSASEVLHKRLRRLGAIKNAAGDKVLPLDSILQRYAMAVWDKTLNPASQKQLQDFFYTKMRLPEVWQSKKGVKKLSMDREALEKLEQYFFARPIIAAILAIRDLEKQLQVFSTEIDADGRWRTSYNIAGTETGRPSSSKSSTGTGSNTQNIDPALRYPFVADKGYKLCNIDASQSEARDVGFLHGCLFGDWRYLDNCECLTADHEVLTPNGWVSISSKPDDIATWDNGKIQFVTPQKWNEGIANALISIESRAISMLCTPDHSMPVYGWNNSGFQKRTATDIQKSPNFTAPASGKFIGGSYRERFAKLKAAFQADGTLDNQGKVHFSFMKLRKIKAMAALLAEQNIKHSVYHLGTGATRFYIHAGQGFDKWNKECNDEILEWDAQSISEFCWSHSLWDGHQDTSNLTITSKSKSHIDWLATAYYLNGNNTSVAPSKLFYWKLTVKENKNMQYRSAIIKDVYAPGTKVFCPTVHSGFFLVRRNNKIYISGNSGDLHTNNCKLIWPELTWTGDAAADLKVAEQEFYYGFSYRDMSKRGGHLSNYYGTPYTAARSLKVPLKVMEKFRADYLEAFPSFPRWWDWTAQQLQLHQELTTPFGRRRRFFGRPKDDTTLREAIAFIPQSMTAERVNFGMWKIWQHMPEVQLLGNGFDSIVFQFPEELEAEVVPKALALMETPLFTKQGRQFSVPMEAKIGWNWGDHHRTNKPISEDNKFNPNGLLKWKPDSPDKRIRLSGLDAPVL